jgi:beta-glucanase (GH16 family)
MTMIRKGFLRVASLLKFKKSEKTIAGLAFCAILVLSLNCKKESEPYPEISFPDASLERSVSDNTMTFSIKISKPVANTISVDYSVSDGTAVSPGDFTAASGTATIAANETEGKIDVLIKGDPLNLRQPNLQFNVNLSNPKFCAIPDATAKGVIITQDGTYLPTDNNGYATPESYPGYRLAWSDEFSGTSLNLTSWNQEVGNGTSGWGNNELEYYTDSQRNTFVSNGNLIIEARKGDNATFPYTSGRMTTQGKRSFKFGRIDIRAKLPVGIGMWPALWMLGSNLPTVGWPACGEIDIMELIGSYPARVTGTMHWKPSSGASLSKGANYTLAAGNFSQLFHVFSIIWTQDNIKWYIDDELFLSTSIVDVGLDNYPFNDEQFFIFNLAVGGNWPGAPDYTTLFPQRMFVDYVRVFQVQ